jgi:hypothetical protein
MAEAEFKGEEYIFPDEQEDTGKPVDTEALK